MRELVAGLVALLLLLVALSLAGALQLYRRRRQSSRASATSRGHRIVAELPSGSDLTLFTDGPDAFAHGDVSIPKAGIRGVQLLINGAPIAAATSPRFPDVAPPVLAVIDDQFDGLLRDRWDVAIDTVDGTVMVECGAIRERVSQQLARDIFDAVTRVLEDGVEEATTSN